MTLTPQKMNIRVFLSACTVFLAIAAPSQGQLVDNFNYANNAALEGVWGAPALGGDTATSFTYNTGTGTLNATGLTDSTIGGYATATFSRPVSHSGNLHASMEFDWDQSLVLGAMFLELRGPGGVIASGGLGDDTGGPGHAYMQIGGNTTYLGPNGGYVSSGENTFELQTGAIATSFQNAPIVSGAADAVRIGNSLGDSGSARLDILRFGDQIRLRIDNGNSVFSLGPISGPTTGVTSIDLIFAGFAFGDVTNVLVGNQGSHIAISSVSLTTPNAPGDTNGDGVVNINDYLLIRQNSFTAQPLGQNGDTNYDGFVDFTDFQIWKANFPGGAVAAKAAIAALAVPEPSAVCLIGMGIGMFLFGPVRRRNR